MSRGSALLVWLSLSAAALLVASPLLHADPPPPTPPPGFKVIYKDIGGGKKMALFVQQQADPLAHANLPSDPLDPQKVYSETNPMANKSFVSGAGTEWNKSAEIKDAYPTKVFNSTGPNSIYNLGDKSAFPTSAFAGGHAATGYAKSYATKTADADQDETATFAAIGSADQNRTAPINPKTIDTYSAPMADKTYMTAKADGVHHGQGELGNGTALSQLPDRPLTIDEVRNLINHGFKADTSTPPPPASKPLNDPGYQPEPLRIEPSEPEIPAPRNAKDDDDKDDPVPPPGTMADPPENSEPLPK